MLQLRSGYAARVEDAAALARIGAVLSGKWRLDALLGVGGMAWVYAATHRNHSRAALKLLKPEHAADADLRMSFLREGYLANSVGHPNVRLVLDDDDASGSAYLVMELLSGKSLSELRALHGGRLPARAVLEATAEVLDVLATAHEKHIVHRDIKPQNVFLTDAGVIKVLDFGIAEMRDALRRSIPEEGFVGTPAYSAPEQVREDRARIGPRTDLWGVGATMFRLLTGEHVHEAPSVAEQLYRASSVPARSLGSAAPDLPGAVVEIVDRALRFDPDERFAGAREMQAAVRFAQSGLAGLPLVVLLASRPSLAPPAPEPTTRIEPLAEPTVETGRPPLLARPRTGAHATLAELGVSGADLHLLDTIPLIEMIWADGLSQAPELRILGDFLERHVQNVNELAGREAVTLEHAQAFVGRFLVERPDPELLRLLRSLFVELRLDAAPDSVREMRRRAVLDFCLDLGAACVAEYPHGDRQRFCKAEKDLFESLVESLAPSPG